MPPMKGRSAREMAEDVSRARRRQERGALGAVADGLRPVYRRLTLWNESVFVLLQPLRRMLGKAKLLVWPSRRRAIVAATVSALLAGVAVVVFVALSPATLTPVPAATATPAASFTSDEAIAAVKRYVMDQRDPSLPSSVSRLQLSLLSGRDFTSLARWDGTKGRWRVTVDREPFWFYEATEVVEYSFPTPTP